MKWSGPSRELPLRDLAVTFQNRAYPPWRIKLMNLRRVLARCWGYSISTKIFPWQRRSTTWRYTCRASAPISGKQAKSRFSSTNSAIAFSKWSSRDFNNLVLNSSSSLKFRSIPNKPCNNNSPCSNNTVNIPMNSQCSFHSPIIRSSRTKQLLKICPFKASLNQGS